MAKKGAKKGAPPTKGEKKAARAKAVDEAAGAAGLLAGLGFGGPSSSASGAKSSHYKSSSGYSLRL